MLTQFNIINLDVKVTVCSERLCAEQGTEGNRPLAQRLSLPHLTHPCHWVLFLLAAFTHSENCYRGSQASTTQDGRSVATQVPIKEDDNSQIIMDAVLLVRNGAE